MNNERLSDAALDRLWDEFVTNPAAHPRQPAPHDRATHASLTQRDVLHALSQTTASPIPTGAYERVWHRALSQHGASAPSGARAMTPPPIAATTTPSATNVHPQRALGSWRAWWPRLNVATTTAFVLAPLLVLAATTISVGPGSPQRFAAVSSPTTEADGSLAQLAATPPATFVNTTTFSGIRGNLRALIPNASHELFIGEIEMKPGTEIVLEDTTAHLTVLSGTVTLRDVLSGPPAETIRAGTMLSVSGLVSLANQRDEPARLLVAILSPSTGMLRLDRIDGYSVSIAPYFDYPVYTSVEIIELGSDWIEIAPGVPDGFADNRLRRDTIAASSTSVSIRSGGVWITSTLDDELSSALIIASGVAEYRNLVEPLYAQAAYDVPATIMVMRVTVPTGSLDQG